MSKVNSFLVHSKRKGCFHCCIRPIYSLAFASELVELSYVLFAMGQIKGNSLKVNGSKGSNK